MITLKNVTKEYHLGGDIKISPVRNVNLEIAAGEFVMIVGRSGSGKSTLLNLAAGLTRPTSGQVLIDKVDVSHMSDKDISALRSQKVGFVFQFPSLLPSLTILENVTLPTTFATRSETEATTKRGAGLLKSIGLAQRTQVYPRQLSAGEQKRAVIARALINQPKIILADEPTSDLDVQTEMEVMGMLQEIHHRGVTIMMVTHSMPLVSFADRAFKMDNGVLSQVATKASVAAS
jgi:ABC-type lipoprotein export system ATPase subunit